MSDISDNLQTSKVLDKSSCSYRFNRLEYLLDIVQTYAHIYGTSYIFIYNVPRLSYRYTLKRKRQLEYRRMASE